MKTDKISDLPRALHSGELNLGGTVFPCFVLEDGRRVISQQSFFRGLEFDGHGSSLVQRILHPFQHRAMANDRIRKIIDNVKKPVEFTQPNGTVAFGYEGTLLVDYCREIIKARRQKILGAGFDHIAFVAEGLLLALSKLGITALIDEATGYQNVRPRDALRALIDQYIAKELAAWTKRFPDDFYIQLFRLKKWNWNEMAKNKPSVVGHYTNEIVYERLAPGVLDELRRLNPADDHGVRAAKHHQWLSDKVGHPALAQHLHAVVALMRAAPNWSRFREDVQRAFPKKGDNLLLELELDE